MATEAEDDTRARDDAADGADGKPKKGKKPDRKQMIIVVASVVGVVIAFLTYRSRSASTAAPGASSNVPLSESGTNGQVLGSGGTVDQSSIDQGFQQLLAGQQSLLNLYGATPSGTQTGQPSTYSWAQFVAQPSSLISFIRDAANGAIYEVEPTASGGSVYYHLTPAEYAQLGNPTFTNFGKAGGTPAKLPTGFQPPPVQAAGGQVPGQRRNLILN